MTYDIHQVIVEVKKRVLNTTHFSIQISIPPTSAMNNIFLSATHHEYSQYYLNKYLIETEKINYKLMFSFTSNTDHPIGILCIICARSC